MESARSRALRLELATEAFALVETGVGVFVSLLAGSVALTGVSLESAIKVVVSLVVLWALWARRAARTEARVLRLLALGFFAVAALLAADAIHALLTAHHAERSTPALILTVAGAIILPPLVVAKGRLAKATGNRVLRSSAAKTRLYALLSLIALAGIVVSDLGWWWADSVAALGVAGLAAYEGIQDSREASELHREHRHQAARH
ncbi:MAG: cation transporter [Candidatus Dormibacteraeota bacterium]|nr:cation transporter [Candidatus Dormibacteraeota bacterium]